MTITYRLTELDNVLNAATVVLNGEATQIILVKEGNIRRPVYNLYWQEPNTAQLYKLNGYYARNRTEARQLVLTTLKNQQQEAA